MRFRSLLALAVAGAFLSACGGGTTGSAGTFQLVQFLESGKDGIPRNRILTFIFTAPVAGLQDFAERLKIENVQSGGGSSNFARAIGTYIVSGDRVTFTPRLPEKIDRSDAGLRSKGAYHVFLKGGPDSLRSTEGDGIVNQQEFLFDTSDFFEDPVPAQPPRALGLVARDPANPTIGAVDISRIRPLPGDLALVDSKTLVDAARTIEPGTGSQFATPWNFELALSEPMDPSTVNTDNIKMFEIRNDALTTATTAPADHFGISVEFAVPIRVSTIQRPNAAGVLEFIIRVTPVQTLVDDARYRLIFSGNLLGLDFRKTFIGDNGLTGDGTTPQNPSAGARPSRSRADSDTPPSSSSSTVPPSPPSAPSSTVPARTASTPRRARPHSPRRSSTAPSTTPSPIPARGSGSSPPSGTAPTGPSPRAEATPSSSTPATPPTPPSGTPSRSRTSTPTTTTSPTRAPARPSPTTPPSPTSSTSPHSPSPAPPPSASSERTPSSCASPASSRSRGPST
ncbi:MAG: hypothetical protein HC813_01090 [Planctomycetes bacterium]|nr:hypothetical protein [Planctomycetota bacterium]